MNIFSLNSKKVRVEEKQRSWRDVLSFTIFRDTSLYVTFLEVGVKVPKCEMHLVSHPPHIGAKGCVEAVWIVGPNFHAAPPKLWKFFHDFPQKYSSNKNNLWRSWLRFGPQRGGAAAAPRAQPCGPRRSRGARRRSSGWGWGTLLESRPRVGRSRSRGSKRWTRWRGSTGQGPGPSRRCSAGRAIPRGTRTCFEGDQSPVKRRWHCPAASPHSTGRFRGGP